MFAWNGRGLTKFFKSHIMQVKYRKSGFEGDTLWRLPSDAAAPANAGERGAPVEHFAAAGENRAEPLHIGENPSTLEETRGFSNLEGGGVTPPD
ncbi:MAG: hypothetical protein HY290_13330 [Planctomycetia bacterium]|nr:hypothetical protein [Planctomycetia bacterium]